MDLSPLLKKERVLFDGAMGTLLQSMTAVPEPPELLNSDRKDIVEKAHALYAQAGSRAVETNTLGANPIKLKRTPHKEECAPFNADGVACARKAVGEEGVVALSIGSTGQLLAPMGPLSRKDAVAGYREQIEAGTAAGADVAYIETMMDLSEARCAALAAGQAGMPFVISFTFEPKGVTLMGNSPESCALCAKALGAVAVGVNCSGGPEQLLPVLKRMRAACDLPVIMQPNAGLPEVRNNTTYYPLGPDEFAAAMRDILDAGAAAVGGCCGTTPDHIAALAQVLKDYPTPPEATCPPTYLCSGRKYVPADCEKEEVSGEDVYDLQDELAEVEADAAIVDLTAFDAGEIGEMIPELTSTCALPLCFRCADSEGAAAALAAYDGVAGLLLEGGEEVAARYGAVLMA